MCFVSDKFYDIKNTGSILLRGVTAADGKKCKMHALWCEEQAFGVNSKAKIYEPFDQGSS